MYMEKSARFLVFKVFYFSSLSLSLLCDCAGYLYQTCWTQIRNSTSTILPLLPSKFCVTYCIVHNKIPPLLPPALRYRCIILRLLLHVKTDAAPATKPWKSKDRGNSRHKFVLLNSNWFRYFVSTDSVCTSSELIWITVFQDFMDHGKIQQQDKPQVVDLVFLKSWTKFN